MSKWLALNLLVLTFLTCQKPNTLKVACLGDSITQGARVDSLYSYPNQLQSVLSKNYIVRNFGVSSNMLLRKGVPTIWSQVEEIVKFEPHIIVISLGTNDTCGDGQCGTRKGWEFRDEFATDYKMLIDTLRKISTSPEIYICTPTPMVTETEGLDQDRAHGLSIRKPRLKFYIDIIFSVAKDKNVQLIDLHSSLANKPELFTIGDGVHPNSEGYLNIAQLIANEIKK